jgi:uncharacterized protein (TIGR02598 family)
MPPSTLPANTQRKPFGARGGSKHFAFSLIEVTIALGVLSFVLVSIMGLLSGSFSIARDAANDSALTSIARNVVDDLRGRAFDELPGVGTTITELRYFIQDGSPCSEKSDGSAIAAGAVYKATIDGAPDAALKGADGTVNLVKLRLRLQRNANWPSDIDQDANKQDIYVEIACY